MALFGKKKEEQKTPACACNLDCPRSEVTETADGGCPESQNGICSVKVLGSGCASCHAQFENAKKAVKNMGLSLETEYVTDLQKIMEYGVMSMPALVINEKVAAAGKVLKPKEIEKLLRKSGF